MSDLPGSRMVASYRQKQARAAITRAKRSYKAKTRMTFPSPSEKKYFDTALSFNLDATGEVPASGQLCLIPQGTGESQRVGRKVTVTSIYINGAIGFAPGAGAISSDIATIYVVLDTQCNGAAAAVTDVLTGTNVVTAMVNMDNSARFRILKKFVIPMQSTAGVTTAYGQQYLPINWYSRCNIPLDYSADTGAIGEIRSNNIFLVAGSFGATDDLMTVAGTCRLRYID